MKKQFLISNEQGFGLIELALALTVVMGLGTALFSATTGHYAQVQRVKDVTALNIADRQLLHYAAIHGRLPCADANDDGVENCEVNAKGTLPYKTIGLIVTGYTPGEVPLRYGVYRKADSSVTSQDSAVSKDADLATPGNINRFEPTSSDSCSYDLDIGQFIVLDSATPVCPGKKLNNFADLGFNRIGTLDLCLALNNGSAHSASSSNTFTRSPANVDNPVAYVLAAAGSVDGDNMNGLFDGLNGDLNSPGFNSSATPAQTTYDDQTLARSFTEVFQHLRCAVTMRSLDELADAVTVEDEVRAQQLIMQNQAEQAVEDSIVGAASTAITVVLAGLAVKGASELATAAGVSLGANTALCASSLGVNVLACANVGLGTAAVASAGTAMGLSVTALVLAIAAEAAQIAAAILFDDVATEAGAAIATPSADLATLKEQQLANAVADRNEAYLNYLSAQSSANAATAYIATIGGTTAGPTARTAMDAAISTMTFYKTAYTNWMTKQTAADARNKICTDNSACAIPIPGTSPTTYNYFTDHSDYISWQGDKAIADNALTALNTAKTTVIEQWDLAVKAGRAWDVDALGGNGNAATCDSVSSPNNSPTTTSPIPLDWWPTYTIQTACVLAGQFQDALNVAKDKEAASLETMITQSYNQWKSMVANAEQAACTQPAPIRRNFTYIAAVSSIPPDTSIEVPKWTTTLGPEGPYVWWGSCSSAPTTATMKSITSGARAILDRADKLGVTQ